MWPKIQSAPRHSKISGLTKRENVKPAIQKKNKLKIFQTHERQIKRLGEEDPFLWSTLHLIQ